MAGPKGFLGATERDAVAGSDLPAVGALRVMEATAAAMADPALGRGRDGEDPRPESNSGIDGLMLGLQKSFLQRLLVAGVVVENGESLDYENFVQQPAFAVIQPTDKASVAVGAAALEGQGAPVRERLKSAAGLGSEVLRASVANAGFRCIDPGQPDPAVVAEADGVAVRHPLHTDFRRIGHRQQQKCCEQQTGMDRAGTPVQNRSDETFCTGIRPRMGCSH